MLRGEVEAIVVGGGPAGAAAARLLASWGHAVLLLARAPRGPQLAESITPSSRKLLRAVGVDGAVDRAGFYRSRGNTVWWTEREPRVEPFAAGETGYQVERHRFDRVLQAEAVAAGATAPPDAHVAAVRLPEAGEASGAPAAAPVEVVYQCGGRRETRSSALVLDCSGRAGMVARQGFRRWAAGAPTLAVVGVWTSPDWAVPDETHTLVEAYARGWVWSVPVSPTVRYIATMVDPRVRSRTTDLRSGYLQELGATRQFRLLIDDASLQDGPWACDASRYDARQFAGPGFLLVGDAASFVDPLSSYGVKKALASAWLAAVAAHTSLVHPDMASVAFDFFADRERRVWSSISRQAAEYFRMRGREDPHSFWTERAGLDEASSDEAADTGAADVDLALGHAEQAAFETLRQTTRIRLAPSSGLRFARGPAVQGREIVLETRVVLQDADGASRAVRYWRGVDLPRLIALSSGPTAVPDLYEIYNAQGAAVELPAFLGALALLLGRGALTNQLTGAGANRGL